MAITLNGTSGITFPAGGTGNPAGTVVGTSDTQTMTNKTLAIIKSASSGTPTVFQDSNGTEVGTLCRAWVYFNGTPATPTLNASFNVSSVTKSGSGSFTINFTNAMPDTKFSIFAMCGTGGGAGWCIDWQQNSARTTTSAKIGTLNYANSLTDFPDIDFSAFR